MRRELAKLSTGPNSPPAALIRPWMARRFVSPLTRTLISPVWPFSTAVKIATHDRQTFYNVGHHAFLDRDGGKTIHFEGTYTNDFSGNPEKTPRYNYNQVLYRLDLGSEAVMSLKGK